MRCADRSLLDEPLAGTAPEASGFVLVEHRGPWGERALEEAGLGELEARCKELRLKALLVRAAAGGVDRGRVLAAWSGRAPFAVELDGTRLDVALEELGAGVAPSGLPLSERLWLVCTNGKRDLCCARNGVPVARALAQRLPDRVFECTHLGGHRLAANVLLLPEGLCFGRVTPERVDGLLAAVEAGSAPGDLLRGRTSFVPAAQAAEAALGEVSVAAPEVVLDGDLVRVGDRAVRVWEEELPPRPISCGVEPEPITAWRSELVA